MYGSQKPKPESKKSEDKEPPTKKSQKPKPEDKEPPAKPAKSSKKLTDKQKGDLKKHMDKLDMTVSEKKSHRMKMMGKMRKGQSVKKAHSAIMK